MRRYEGDLRSSKFVISKPLLTLSVFFNHAECSEWTNLSLELNSPFHCGLCSSAVSLSRSNSHAKITELPAWQRGDYGFNHYRHGNMSWEWELLVWYCTLSFSSLLLRGWEFRPLCSLENRGGKSIASFCAQACKRYNFNCERWQGFLNKLIPTLKQDF